MSGIGSCGWLGARWRGRAQWTFDRCVRVWHSFRHAHHAGLRFLLPLADCVARVLGDSHPISREVERLARERMGAEERRRREAQRAADEERRVQR